MNNNPETNETVNQNQSRPASGWLTKAAIGGALVAALGGWYYQSEQVNSVRQELAQSQQKMDQLQGQVQTSVSVARTEVNETIAKLNEEVAKARADAQKSASRVQVAAKQQTGQVMESLTAKNKELAAQLEQLKQDNEAKTTEVQESLSGIKGDVGSVKTEVTATRSELAQTISDLKRMTGDMGLMSGLIATNSTELAALRKLGEKDYYEFSLPRTGKAQRVGEIQMALKKTDLKRNRFTMDVLADDKKIEKKDRSLNEPVQFYTSNARLPYEVVVNEITKDKVVGYLAVPKVKEMARR